MFAICVTVIDMVLKYPLLNVYLYGHIQNLKIKTAVGASEIDFRQELTEILEEIR